MRVVLHSDSGPFFLTNLSMANKLQFATAYSDLFKKCLTDSGGGFLP